MLNNSWRTQVLLFACTMASEQERLRLRVVQYYNTHRDEKKSMTVTHFASEGVSKRTIYHILQKYSGGESVRRRIGSGRPAKIMTESRVSWLKKKMMQPNQPSTRSVARLLKCSHSHVVRTVKQKARLKCKKKMKCPMYTEDQIAMVKSTCRKLHDFSKNKTFILDDEKYFSLSGDHMPGNSYYYTDTKHAPIQPHQVKRKKKFEAKVMLWLAISQFGISQPYIVPSGLAVNKDLYIKECLQKRLLPFINNKHDINNCLFWPDKASAHYARDTLNFLRENGIPFVPKELNPTNLPQCRPIEDLFGHLSQEVYKNGWSASNPAELKQRILYCLRRMDLTSGQSSCSTIRKKLRKCYKKGPLSCNH
jgi:transposase